jgi:phenylacetate-CoA ligase
MKNIWNMISDGFLTFKGVFKYSMFLKRSQFFSIDEIEMYQSRWLSVLLTHAHHNIPWYSAKFRIHGVDHRSASPLAELKKLPILTKEEVRAYHSDFCISGAEKSAIKFQTSGTTGRPLIAYTSPNQWVIEQGVIWRQWKSAGYRFRDKVAIFRSYAPEKGGRNIKHDVLRNWSYFSVFNLSDSAIDEYARYLQKWQPKFLRGYPSSLNLVAEHAIRFGWTLPSLKGALSASEVVHPNLRENLDKAFGIKLFDHYGQAEITCMFHECEEHSGMHYNWEYGLVELVATDDKSVHKIIATNLHNLAMPLLRYDTGDLAVGDWESCKCGRSSYKVQSIRGRGDDYLLLSNNSRVSTVNLYTFFSKIDGLRQFQMIQEAAGELIVIFDLGDGSTSQEIGRCTQEIATYFESNMGICVTFRSKSEFNQSADGKLPVFIQRAKYAA